MWCFCFKRIDVVKWVRSLELLGTITFAIDSIHVGVFWLEILFWQKHNRIVICLYVGGKKQDSIVEVYNEITFPLCNFFHPQITPWNYDSIV